MSDDEIIEVMMRDRESECFRNLFRDALTALRSAGYAVVLREPTMAMGESARITWNPDTGYCPYEVWRAMISAAEGEKENGGTIELVEPTEEERRGGYGL